MSKENALQHVIYNLITVLTSDVLIDIVSVNRVKM
jgi:hypothetical protein